MNDEFLSVLRTSLKVYIDWVDGLESPMPLELKIRQAFLMIVKWIEKM